MIQSPRSRPRSAEGRRSPVVGRCGSCEGPFVRGPHAIYAQKRPATYVSRRAPI
nr:MAG TPA: hypothetical protein [Caudoviricetes sp.]